ncbi:menaquinone biosynthesis protein [Paenibacillus cisolokensis]|uniref:menaquinone biosynthesis protein n=1 Tax=Paenibacillus cisolokensis TaxID=1658519 RepID=UPI003D282461
MGREGPLTLGRIDYANAWPLFHHLDGYAGEAGVRIVSRVPAELNRALREGETDISAISSFAYAQNSEDYLLLPDLSVSSVGRVNSILLFMKRPLEQVKNGRIALTTASATSVNLLKIIMAKYAEGQPQYERAEPDLDSMLENADAALLIGDPAIRASWSAGKLHVLDLGELWHRWTGLGMTYAVVAVRKEAAARWPQAIASLLQAMRESKRLSLGNPQALIDDACRTIGGEPGYWARYFTELRYDFGPMQQQGLALYFRLARQLGLLERDVHMEFFSEQSALQVNE